MMQHQAQQPKPVLGDIKLETILQFYNRMKKKQKKNNNNDNTIVRYLTEWSTKQQH